MILETERLVLRPWAARDLAPFAALNADPQVRTFFPGVLDRAQSDATIARMADRRALDGFGFSAVERRSDGAFLGMCGLCRVRFDAPCAINGIVEIGWRLAAAYWGRGYATEAARGWLAHGFDTLGLDEIVAFAVPQNAASLAVMARIGMTPDPARDFDHPALPAGHRLRRHVLWARRR